MNIVITGGGTGGHIYPALAVASALQELHPGLRLLYAGRSGGPEERLAVAAGLPFAGLPGRPLVSGAGAVSAAAHLARGVLAAARMLAREQPACVVGTGGFASAAVCAAQAARRRPLVLVDGNALPGRTVRLLARRAAAVCTAFEEAATSLPGCRVVRTGYPVRAEFAARRDRCACRRAFSLREDAFTLVVVGGSQGAQFLNQLVCESASALVAAGVQILHQTGSRDTLQDAPDVPGWVRIQYIEDVAGAFAAADLVVSRAGASTLAELALQGAAAILVPYPHAQGDHQRLNALSLASEGRAILADQQDLTPQRFINLIQDALARPEELQRLRERIHQWATPGAAHDVARVALEAAAGRGPESERD
ncbi:MAG: UDP-N-acetylglucosamine--N-acetylmuramyl-(pentapeptide) pyrophosphoryl-undecaprenol N-acetylglucosamine transferase [Armatimonadota bacterium]